MPDSISPFSPRSPPTPSVYQRFGGASSRTTASTTANSSSTTGPTTGSRRGPADSILWKYRPPPSAPFWGTLDSQEETATSSRPGAGSLGIGPPTFSLERSIFPRSAMYDICDVPADTFHNIGRPFPVARRSWRRQACACSQSSPGACQGLQKGELPALRHRYCCRKHAARGARPRCHAGAQAGRAR